MTIESHLASIDASLQIIAASLAGGNCSAAAEEPESEPDAKGSAEKAPAKKAAASKKAAKEQELPDGPKIEDVRAALTDLQAATDGKTARELLAKVGGSGALSKVKKAKYADIIEAALKAGEEAAGADE